LRGPIHGTQGESKDEDFPRLQVYSRIGPELGNLDPTATFASTNHYSGAMEHNQHTPPQRSRRNRHGRGRRGPLMPMHLPAYRTRPERFDDAVMASAQRLGERWGSKLAIIDFRIIPVPGEKVMTQAAAVGDRMPLSSARPATAQRRARISVYRLPLEQVSHNHTELVDLVHQCVVHEVANLWMLTPHDVDPEYFPKDPDF